VTDPLGYDVVGVESGQKVDTFNVVPCAGH